MWEDERLIKEGGNYEEHLKHEKQNERVRRLLAVLFLMKNLLA